MRFKLFSVLAVLLLVGSNDARPSKIASPEVAVEEASIGGKDDDSSWRPKEQSRSSSAVKSDSRYRGRTESNRKLNDIYYRASFTPGIVNSFKTDADFGLPGDWQILGASRLPEPKFRSESNVSAVPDEPERKISPNSRRSHNDRFSKLYTSSTKEFRTVNDDESNTPDFRSDDHNSAEIKIEGAESVGKILSRTSIQAKNRVVIKTGSVPLSYETPLQPLSPPDANNQNDTSSELKNWPNEPIADDHDLFNYEKYTASIDGTLQHSSALNYGDAPIYNGTTKKKPSNQFIKPLTNNHHNYHNGSVGHKKVPTTTSPESFGTSSGYDREPFTQPNVQKIIQWLQIPPLASGKNQSDLAHNVVREEPVGNGFDQSYPFNPNRPVAPLGSYYEPQSSYPTQSHRPSQTPNNNRPLGSYYELQSHYPIATQNHRPSQSPNRYQTSQKPYEPLTHPYQQLHNHNQNQHPENFYLPPDVDNPNPPANSAENSYLPADFGRPYPPPVRPAETITLPTSVVTLLADLASKKPSPPRRPTVFRPTSEITQNTIVHILNPGSKKPNVTVSGMKVPQVPEPTGSSETNSTATPPNLHIMFMNEEMQNAEKPSPDKVTESPFRDKDCPTIMINSITRVNNTIESKAGCSDLNIVINSQVLSTNVFKPGGLPEGDDNLQDKDVNAVSPGSPPKNPYDDYNAANTQDPYSDSTAGSGQVNGDPDRNDLSNIQAVESEDDSFVATSEVVQASEIYVSTGDPQESAFDALGSEFSDASDVVPGMSDPVPSVGGDPPEVAQASAVDSVSPVGQAIGESSADPAPIGLLPGLPGAVAGTGGSGIVESGSTALATASNENDDDEYDFDLSPSGLVESMGNAFSYFTFLNPLNYGIFSMAAAPFAAMAAGIVGIAAVLFPWTLPGVLDFGRAADKVTIKFTPSLDEVVKHSIHKYRNWHEWKSKRKKRKR